MTIRDWQVGAVLDGQEGVWDTAAIAADLTEWDAIDEVPEAHFWDVVARHQLPDPDPAGDFRRELSTAIAAGRAGRDAIWSDGVVTVRARGVSRVNQELPQPTASFVIQTATDEVTLDGGGEDGESVTWGGLWAAVCDARATAQCAANVATSRLRDATATYRRAEQAANDARAARDGAVRAAVAAGVDIGTITSIGGISAPMVYKLTRAG